MLGAAAGQVLAEFTGERHLSWVLAGVTVLLTMAAILGTAPEPMVFAMGALNASMQRAGNIPVSVTSCSAARPDQPLTLYAICKERNLPPVLCHPGGGTQWIYALRARPRAYS